MQALERKNKKKNFVWNALGLSFNAFNSLFFMIIVTLVNGVDLAGIFTYAFSLCCFFFVFSMYYTRTFQVSDSKNKFSFNEYLGCRVILSIVSLILIIVFSMISQFDFYKIFVIVLIMGFRTVEAISDCFYGVIQKHGELYKTGISLTAKAIGGVLLFLILDLLTHNLLLSIGTLIITNIIFFIFYDLKNYHKISKEKIHLSIKNISEILKICFPVFLFTALSIYLTNCQKYILTYFEPNDVQTIFGILIMPATFLNIVGAYLINPFINRMTILAKRHKYKDFQQQAKKILGILILGGIICVTVCWFIGIPILNIIYNLDLSNYRLSLVIIVLSAVFYAATMIISNFLTILKNNVWQSVIYIIVSIFATISSLWLITQNGINGAVVSFLISGLLLALLYLILFSKAIYNLKKRQRDG